MSAHKAPRDRDPFDGVTAVNEGFEVITAVNENPIPREALPTDAIEPILLIEPVGRAEPVPVRAEPVPVRTEPPLAGRPEMLSVTNAVPIRVTDANSAMMTTEMPPLVRRDASAGRPPFASAEIPPLAPPPPAPAKPALAGTPWEPSAPARPSEPRADFAYPAHPGTPVWHYLVLGAAVASLVVVALSVLSSLGFAPLGHL